MLVWSLNIFVGMLLMFNGSAVLASDDVEIPLAQGVVKLIKPIEVNHADMLKDGGTITITLKDAKDQWFPLCLDGRMKVLKFGEKLKPYSIFVNATTPDTPGAQILSVGGQEEKVILRILKDWISENISEADQNNLLDISKFKNIVWTDKLYKARRVLQLIEELKNR